MDAALFHQRCKMDPCLSVRARRMCFVFVQKSNHLSSKRLDGYLSNLAFDLPCCFVAFVFWRHKNRRLRSSIYQGNCIE